MLFIAHDLGVVRQVCDRVAIMYAGKIFEVSSAAEIMDNPQNPYTLGLMGSIPDLDRRTDRLQPIDGTVPDLIGWERGCLFSTRCPEVMDECRQVDPALVLLPPQRTKEELDHRCRCIRREPGSQ